MCECFWVDASSEYVDGFDGCACGFECECCGLGGGAGGVYVVDEDEALCFEALCGTESVHSRLAHVWLSGRGYENVEGWAVVLQWPTCECVGEVWGPAFGGRDDDAAVGVGPRGCLEPFVEQVD